MDDFEKLIKKFKTFNINAYYYDISMNLIPRYCIIKLNYSRKISVSILTKEFMNFFEFICFIIGCTFELKKLYYTIDNKEICKILNLNSKFHKKRKI